MTDKERADALRAEALVLQAEAEVLNAELQAARDEVTAYMAQSKTHAMELRAAIDEKIEQARALSREADTIDPDPQARHVRIGG